MPDRNNNSFYFQVGGEKIFSKIAKYFYEFVNEEPILIKLYPLNDLKGAEERLKLFLIQYWGGPKKYSELRGHPRLRIRHSIFKITQIESNAWVNCMNLALEKVSTENPISEEQINIMQIYFEQAANAMINSN